MYQAPHLPHLLTPPHSIEDPDAKDLLSERGRKRRRSSAANQVSQLPSNTLRGRARRRSSSLHLTTLINASNPDPLSNRHRSKSPEGRSRIYGKEGQAKSKYAKNMKLESASTEADEKANAFQSLKDLRDFKKRRDQSPSRSRSRGHEGAVKARRRQRTRSRSRSHGQKDANESSEVAANSAHEQENDDQENASDEDDYAVDDD